MVPHSPPNVLNSMSLWNPISIHLISQLYPIEHEFYDVENGGPGVYPRLEKILQATPFKLRENDNTPSYYA